MPLPYCFKLFQTDWQAVFADNQRNNVSFGFNNSSHNPSVKNLKKITMISVSGRQFLIYLCVGCCWLPPASVYGWQTRPAESQYDASRFTPPRNSRLADLEESGTPNLPLVGLSQDRELSIGRLDGSRLYLDICTVHFIDDVKLPARESGQILELNIREGAPFKARQVLAELDYRLFSLALERARLQYDIAMEKANDQLAIIAAENEENLQKIRLNRNTTLRQKGSISQEELEISQYEYQLALLKISREKVNQKNAEGEMKIEDAKIQEVREHIARHQLMVDFDGYVIEKLKQKFEWVNAGEPVLRVARLDQLEIHALVDAKVIDPHRIRPDQTVTVTLNMADNKTEVFQGKITSVALMREWTDVFRIKAEVDNRLADTDAWLLQPQAKVSMVVELN
jgi:hypothetical protein